MTRCRWCETATVPRCPRHPNGIPGGPVRETPQPRPPNRHERRRAAKLARSRHARPTGI